MWPKLKRWFYFFLITFIVFIFFKIVVIYQGFVLDTFREKTFRALAMGIPLSLLMLIDVTGWNYRWGPLGALIAQVLKYMIGIFGWILVFYGFLNLIGFIF